MGILAVQNDWMDFFGTHPPHQWEAVAADSRYWFTNNGDAFVSRTMTYDGADPIPATMAIAWEITVAPSVTEGNVVLKYDSGSGPQTIVLGNVVGAGTATLDLTGATGLSLYVTVETVTFASYGAQAAIAEAVAVAPVDYNCECDDATLNETLAQLRRRMLVELGYAAQANTPPPGMADLLDDWLRSSQRTLYRKWKPLRTERFYTWEMMEGTRFYDVMDNQETCTKRLDAYRVTWVGVKDLSDRFYPLRKGIDPSRYTWLSKEGLPDSYEIRECIEVFPPPDNAYTLVVKGHFGLEAFAVDEDKTTIDSELVFLWALGRAKAHYGHPDANDIKKEAIDYLAALVGGSHGTARYIPGKRIVQTEPQPILILPEE